MPQTKRAVAAPLAIFRLRLTRHTKGQWWIQRFANAFSDDLFEAMADRRASPVFARKLRPGRSQLAAYGWGRFTQSGALEDSRLLRATTISPPWGFKLAAFSFAEASAAAENFRKLCRAGKAMVDRSRHNKIEMRSWLIKIF